MPGKFSIKFFIWFLKKIDKNAPDVGKKLIPIEPAALKKRAQKIARLDDFGDGCFEEGLEVLCNSLNDEACLNVLGRLFIREYLTDTLVTQLRRIELVSKNPGIFMNTALNKPLIIIGLPRSGTTFLHRLLSLASDARFLKMWEVRMPLPGRGADIRRKKAKSILAMMKQLTPDLDKKHFLDVDEPEECMFLLDSTMLSPSFWTMAPVYTYINWYLIRDHAPAYETYREFLHFFQQQTPDKRFTLKAPAHTGHLDMLFKSIPNVSLIQTHRDPVQVVSSVSSLLGSVHTLICKRLDIEKMARTNMSLLEMMVTRNMEQRKKWSHRILDVRYNELLENPVDVVHKIHKTFDLPWSSDFENRIRDWAIKNPQNKYGRHIYSAGEFGIREEEIASKFSEYRCTFCT